MSEINEPQQEESSWSSYLWDVSKDVTILGAKLTGVVTSEVLSHRFITHYTQKAGICWANVLNSEAAQLSKRLSHNLAVPARWISNSLGMNRIQASNTIAPLVEELEFRLLFQQVILKQIPKTALDTLFPNHKIDMDAPSLKIARSLLTAAVFSLAHFQYHACEADGGVSVFLGGLLYSSLIESGDSLTTTISLHILWNTLGPTIEALI